MLDERVCNLCTDGIESILLLGDHAFYLGEDVYLKLHQAIGYHIFAVLLLLLVDNLIDHVLVNVI